jgi:hypothetical protein
VSLQGCLHFCGRLGIKTRGGGNEGILELGILFAGRGAEDVLQKLAGDSRWLRGEEFSQGGEREENDKWMIREWLILHCLYKNTNSRC